MDYVSIPIHQFLDERIHALTRARNPYAKGWILGPLGDRIAWYEVKVEFDENSIITHLMVQLYHREDKSALFSVHAQMDDGKPKAYRVVFQDLYKYNILISDIQDSILQAFIDGQRKRPTRVY